MANLWNPEAVNQYLHGFAAGDSRLGDLLCLALKKVLSKREQNLSALTALPESPPAWLAQKWGTEHFLHFDARKDKYLRVDIQHIADWLQAALREDAAWLQQVDAQNRPKKLLKIGSLAQACHEADKAMALQAAKLRQQMGPQFLAIEQDSDIEVVRHFAENGFIMARLKNAGALDYETACMGHCLGNGAYDDDVADNKIIVYSLRDTANKPCVTLEVNVKSKSVRQCKGKGNQPLPLKYFAFVKAFIAEQKLGLRDNIRATGMVKWQQSLYSIFDLPNGIVLNEDVDFSYLKTPVKLPEKMVIDGNLILSGVFHDPAVALPQIEAKKIRYVWKNKDDNYHRLDGPALVEKNPYTGNIVTEEWFRNGVTFRIDGPAIIRLYEEKALRKESWYQHKADKEILSRHDGPACVTQHVVTGVVLDETWIYRGRYQRLGGGPVFIAREATTGKIIREDWSKSDVALIKIRQGPDAAEIRRWEKLKNRYESLRTGKNFFYNTSRELNKTT